MGMNSIIGELLGVSSYISKRDGKNIYTIRMVVNDRVVVMFYNDKELYDKLSSLERMTVVHLFGDLRVKDENSFSFVPKSFEI